MSAPGDTPEVQLPLPLDVPVSDGPPTAELAPTNGRLAPHQYDFVAMAMVNAVPTQEIASAVGVEPEYIQRLASGHNKSFERIRDAYRDRMMRATVAWRFRLEEMLEAGYAAINNALTQTRDPKLAAEQAWRVLEAVVPQSRPAPATNGAPAFQLNLNNTQVHNELTTAVQGIFQSVAALKGTIVSLDQDPHVREGRDAIIQVGTPAPEPPLEAPLVGASFSSTPNTEETAAPDSSNSQSEQSPRGSQP